MVELVRFNGLPHLFGKVETQLDRMLGILAWAIKEMDDRYRLMEAVNARDLDSYNLKMLRRGHSKLPRIVIFIDELADLMLSAPDQTEGYLVRLAQMARATGIHLVVATQRPSTDIITGLIKANFPARISFMMASSVDSRVILDTNGAETLMGRGDLLFIDPEASGPQRAQCVLVDDREIEKIIGAPDIKIYCLTNRLNNPKYRAWSEPVLDGYSRVNTTFKQVEEMAQDLKEMGLEKCMILLAGWNRMGYDREHVDMWPPSEEAGGIKGLVKASSTVRKMGFLFALHDNYDDFYPDAPSFDEKYIFWISQTSFES